MASEIIHNVRLVYCRGCGRELRPGDGEMVLEKFPWFPAWGSGHYCCPHCHDMAAVGARLWKQARLDLGRR